MEKIKNKKVHFTVAFGAILAGVALFQGVLPKGAQDSKINGISPSQGTAGTQVVITGSGFTTSVQGIVGTKVKENVYAPGNYVLIKDEVVNKPILSSDGKTLTVRIDLISDKVRSECEQKFSKKNPEPCKVPIKVVNAYGKPSNDVIFTITGRELKKLSFTIEKLDMPAPAVIHAIIPGATWNGDDVMHIRVSAPATNEQPIGGIQVIVGTYTGASGGTPVSCSYFYYIDPISGYTVASGGAWLSNINDPEETYGGPQPYGGTIGLDGGIFTYAPQAPKADCPIYLAVLTPLDPGMHKDYAVHMKMYTQGYTKNNMTSYTPPAGESTSFNLLARAFALYSSPGYYVIDNSPDNGYISGNLYYGQGGVEWNMGLTKLISSDPIKIMPQSIPTPAGYFP